MLTNPPANLTVTKMAKLSAEERKEMPKSKFAGPGKSFPVNDATHARMAISGATRSQHAGNISSSEAAKIKSKARTMEHFFGKGK
jgi:hypothetical protein